MASSNSAVLIGLGALGVYGYSMYYLNGVKMEKGFSEIVPKQLQVYGLYKFLTVQCLVIQLVNSLLHVLAHFVRPLRGLRDLVFTALAFPVGSIVVYTFWLVWFGMGRETIFPARLDEFYPQWLNHATHTIIVPVNLLLAIVVNHKYIKNGAAVTLVYMLGYTIFLHVIKMQTGLFVYGYLNELNDTQRMIYFACTGVFAYLLYKSGSLLRSLVHGSDKMVIKTKSASKGHKQR